MSDNKTQLETEAIALLKRLIATPSFSGEEDGTVSIIHEFFSDRGVDAKKHLHNVWACNQYFNPALPTILLNSHHDTVKPNKAYTVDPFEPRENDGKLFGLGSNDAGGALVSLIAAFLYFHKKENLQYNLVIAATAEEEISGKNGIESLLQDPDFRNALGLGVSDQDSKICAIVGEPTLMQMAVAERGLMVLDCVAKGKAGHAAREEGENAIIKALKDIEWINRFHFEKISTLLGPVKMSVTSIETENKTHNIVPSECSFVVDVRINELYSLEEVLSTIRKHLQSEVSARSTRLKSTSISMEHPLVKAGLKLGRSFYGSPTTSDKALMNFPSLKMGPGDSARSHTADEFILSEEIKAGIHLYISLLEELMDAPEGLKV